MTAEVSCVIPAFNEAARIGDVLAAVVGHPLVAEVIVVDDGSTDGTAAIARARGGVTVVALDLLRQIHALRRLRIKPVRSPEAGESRCRDADARP